jgi:hypothetical protein
MGQEKRKQARLDANLFAQLHSSDGKADFGRAVVVDVSIGGFAVDTEADLVLNQVLSCHIEMPLELKAKVVRAIQEGQVKRYGLQFVGQSFLDKFLLKKILKGKRQTKKVSR